VKPPEWNAKKRFLEPGQKFLRAIDIETGKRIWEVPQIGPADSWGGVISTAGGVVFFGEDSGAFAAVECVDREGSLADSNECFGRVGRRA